MERPVESSLPAAAFESDERTGGLVQPQLAVAQRRMALAPGKKASPGIEHRACIVVLDVDSERAMGLRNRQPRHIGVRKSAILCRAAPGHRRTAAVAALAIGPIVTPVRVAH